MMLLSLMLNLMLQKASKDNLHLVAVTKLV